MYLYIGNDIVINTKDIVGIFDSDKFLNLSEKKGKIISVSNDIPKSFIICRDRKSGDKLTYLCQFSPSTLQKRKTPV